MVSAMAIQRVEPAILDGGNGAQRSVWQEPCRKCMVLKSQEVNGLHVTTIIILIIK